MPSRAHILVVNGRKVHQPVFVIGAPHSGADLLGRALKRTAGFHLTIGQPSVLSVVSAFARTPSIQHGRGEAAAVVLRDAFAQAWQVSAHACLTCRVECRQAQAPGGPRGRPSWSGTSGGPGRPPWASTEPQQGACVDERNISRYADASPALMYCAESLVAAFPDARIVQVVRDGRAVVAAMLADPEELAWFRRGIANVDTEFPNPFFGVETEAEQAAWPALSVAGKCAMRWRGSVHKMARLRSSMRADQLASFRYEQVVSEPHRVAAALGDFVGAKIDKIDPPPGRAGHDSWQRVLSPEQLADIERVAGQQLRRVGYGS